MRTRVQLIENSPLQRVPTVLVTLARMQFMFNVVPTLLRHRRYHKINLFNSMHIFFTKNSIEALGGLPNYLLFRSGAESSNQLVANKVHIFADGQVFQYLEKLRYKLGHKIFRTSYCSWDRKSRIGIASRKLYDELKSDPDLPKMFSRIDHFVRAENKKGVDYYESSDALRDDPTPYITIPCPHFHHQLVDIYPLSLTGEQPALCSFICVPTLRKGGEDLDIDRFVRETSISQQQFIKEFIKYGFIKNGEGDVIRKEQYLYAQDYKPKDIQIFHYTSLSSLTALSQHPILKNYFQNGNKTGLVVHIVEEFSLVETSQFKNFMKNFSQEVKHLWFNKQLHAQNYYEHVQGAHYEEIKFWSIHFPILFNNVQTYNNQLIFHKQTQLRALFPLLNHHFYRSAFQFLLNDNTDDQYSRKIQSLPTQSKVDLLKKRAKEEQKMVHLLATKLNSIQPRIENVFRAKVTFLGTASSMPTATKNTLGILVSLNEQTNIILDCGEGTYQQFVDHFPPHCLEQELLKVKVIFITHIHSDHNLGILNFISQRNRVMRNLGSEDKLYLIIPFNVYNWYSSFCKTIEDLNQGCNVLFTQFLQQENPENVKLEIQRMLSIQTMNKIKGFFGKKGVSPKDKDNKQCSKQSQRFKEFQSSSQTKKLVLKALPRQLQILQSFKKLLGKHGFKTFKPVRVIHCPQSFGIVIQDNKFKVSYSGDTLPSSQFARESKNCNLMIHETTFSDKDQPKAVECLHSTVLEAVQIAKEAQADKIALTHYNQDWKYPNHTLYPTEIQQYFSKNAIFSLDQLNLYLDSMEELPPVTQFMAKTDSEVSDLFKTQQPGVVE